MRYGRLNHEGTKDHEDTKNPGLLLEMRVRVGVLNH